MVLKSVAKKIELFKNLCCIIVPWPDAVSHTSKLNLVSLFRFRKKEYSLDIKTLLEVQTEFMDIKICNNLYINLS